MLAVILFIVDIKTPSYGLLSAGGLAAMFIGSLMPLNNNADPAVRLSLQVIIPVVLVTGAFFVLGVWLSLKSMWRRPVSGAEGLVGQEGETRSAVNRNGGAVFADGTHWNAVADTDISAGTRVKIIAVNHMTLKVEAA